MHESKVDTLHHTEACPGHSNEHLEAGCCLCADHTQRWMSARTADCTLRWMRPEPVQKRRNGRLLSEPELRIQWT